MSILHANHYTGEQKTALPENGLLKVLFMIGGPGSHHILRIFDSLAGCTPVIGSGCNFQSAEQLKLHAASARDVHTNWSDFYRPDQLEPTVQGPAG